MATVNITWTDPNSGAAEEDGVRVYRSQMPMDTASMPLPIVDLPSGSVSFDDTGAIIGDNHYIISAYRAGAERFSAGVVITIGGAAPWDPLDLFASGETGGLYDISDLSTLWQDDAGTIPVTADGDIVALVLDKSGNGNDLWQTNASRRPIYRTDGASHWLEFDGAGDWLEKAYSPGSYPVTLAVATQKITSADAGVASLYRDNSRYNAIMGNAAAFGGLGVNSWAAMDRNASILLNTESAPDFTPQSLIASFDAAELNLEVDLVSATAPTANSNSFSAPVKIYLGTLRPTSFYFAGKVHAFVVLNRALTAAEKSDLNTYLLGKL